MTLAMLYDVVLAIQVSLIPGNFGIFCMNIEIFQLSVRSGLKISNFIGFFEKLRIISLNHSRRTLRCWEMSLCVLHHILMFILNHRNFLFVYFS